MKKIMKLNIAICDDNKLVLENEKALIEETLKEMGIPYKMDKYQNPENLIKNAWYSQYQQGMFAVFRN